MGVISEELKMIDALLMEFHERIQSGRCLTNREQNAMMLSFLHQIANKDEPKSKTQACEYVQVSRATFDRLVACGKMPKGKKIKGFTELVWYEKDLDRYIDRLVNV